MKNLSISLQSKVFCFKMSVVYNSISRFEAPYLAGLCQKWENRLFLPTVLVKPYISQAHFQSHSITFCFHVISAETLCRKSFSSQETGVCLQSNPTILRPKTLINKIPGKTHPGQEYHLLLRQVIPCRKYQPHIQGKVYVLCSLFCTIIGFLANPKALGD